MAWALFAAAGWIVLSLLSYVILIGQPREPIESRQAAFNLAIGSAIVVIMVLAGVMLL